MISPAQIRLVHMAARSAGMIGADGDDARYRVLLHNTGGVTSCKDLTQTGFEDVMAVCESMARQPLGNNPTYWRDKVANRGRLSDSRQLHVIEQLAVDCPYPLAGLVKRFSAGRTDQPEKLTPREASQLIEALKQIISRPRSTAHGATAATSGPVSRCAVAPLREPELFPAGTSPAPAAEAASRREEIILPTPTSPRERSTGKGGDHPYWDAPLEPEEVPF